MISVLITVYTVISALGWSRKCQKLNLTRPSPDAAGYFGPAKIVKGGTVLGENNGAEMKHGHEHRTSNTESDGSLHHVVISLSARPQRPCRLGWTL